MTGTSTAVAVIGAGPYGLSVAAHLRDVGIPTRVFGTPLETWSNRMPPGMLLKSAFHASTIASPRGSHTLDAYCRTAGIDHDRVSPVPVELFLDYARSYAAQLVPDVEDVRVTSLDREHDGFVLTLETGETVHARMVVVATGTAQFAHTPAALASLSGRVASHSSTPGLLEHLAGRDVTVVGAGQSALETAALLKEGGSTVRVLARAPQICWNDLPREGLTPFVQRVKRPSSSLGDGWANVLYTSLPWGFRFLPSSDRVRLATHALGPAGAWWLRARVVDQLPVHTGVAVTGAHEHSDGVTLKLVQADGALSVLETEHVVSATGYRPSLDALPFVESSVRRALTRTGAAPCLDGHLQSSVPGLYFVGALAAPTLGPVMRFVAGTGTAATCITSAVVRAATRQRRTRSPRPTWGLPPVRVTNAPGVQRLRQAGPEPVYLKPRTAPTITPANHPARHQEGPA